MDCITRLSLAMSRDRGLTWNLMGPVDETAENHVVVTGPSLQQVCMHVYCGVDPFWAGLPFACSLLLDSMRAVK